MRMGADAVVFKWMSRGAAWAHPAHISEDLDGGIST